MFSIFLRQRHVRTKEWAKQFVQRPGEPKKHEIFMWFSAAVDTSYSQKSPDTIAFSYLGITNKGKCIVLDEKLQQCRTGHPLAPSDTVKNLIDFLDRNKKEWGLARNVFLDSADQATMQEWNKYKRRNGCIYTLNDAWKKMEIIDRINAQLGWMAFDDQTGIEPCFYVLDTCSTYIHEMEHTVGKKIKTIHQKMGMTIWLTLCNTHGSHTRARFTRGDNYELASEFYCTAIPDRTCKRQGDYNQRSSYLP